MADTIPLQKHAAGEQIRLCTAKGLVYKALRRPYPPGGYVLSLIANGYYDIAPFELYFVGVNGDPTRYQLMENVPKRFFFLTTYYTPCFCSHYGLELDKDYVTIEDAYGEHQVPLENFGT